MAEGSQKDVANVIDLMIARLSSARKKILKIGDEINSDEIMEIMEHLSAVNNMSAALFVSMHQSMNSVEPTRIVRRTEPPKPPMPGEQN